MRALGRTHAERNPHERPQRGRARDPSRQPLRRTGLRHARGHWLGGRGPGTAEQLRLWRGQGHGGCFPAGAAQPPGRCRSPCSDDQAGIRRYAHDGGVPEGSVVGQARGRGGGDRARDRAPARRGIPAVVLALDHAGDPHDPRARLQAHEAVTSALALFDFDGTLTTRDTLLPFLSQVVGPLAWAARLPGASPVLAGYALRLGRNAGAQKRGFERVLSGRERAEIARHAATFARDFLPRVLRARMLARVGWHQAQGHACVVVSASLEAYLVPWAAGNGFAAALGSRLDLDDSGRATGRLRGENCYGGEKVRRVMEWLEGGRPPRVYADGRSEERRGGEEGRSR